MISTLFYNNPYVFVATWNNFWLPVRALLLVATGLLVLVVA